MIGTRARAMMSSTSIPRDRRGVGDVEHVQAVVHDASPLGRGELGGTDVHTAVLLHGVDVDHFTAQSFREIQTEFGLSCGGRADHGNGPDHDRHPSSSHVPT